MSLKVSIIIPCYNTEKWVEQCVLSALNQTYDNFEVIAVDNESTDNTVEILKKIKSSHPELILDSAPNIYRHCWDEPRTKGLTLATGDYFLFLCSDDFLDESFLTNYMKYVSAAPEKILAFQSPIRSLSCKNEEHVFIGDTSHSYKSLAEFKQMALAACPVNTPTVLYSRKLYEKGLLETKPEKYSGAADYDLYCRLADNDVFIYPAPRWLGYYYRWHEEQATWGMHKEKINYDKLIQDHWREVWKN